MKRLKYQQIFDRNYMSAINFSLIVSSVLAIFLPIFELESNENIFFAITFSIIAVFFNIVINCGFMTRKRIKRWEKEKIADAEKLQWKPMTADIAYYIQQNYAHMDFAVFYVIIKTIVAILLLLGYSTIDFTETKFTISTFLIGFFPFAFLISVVFDIRFRRIARIDLSAEYTIIDVDHGLTENKIQHIVLYMYNGKYDLTCSPYDNVPDKIIVAKYKGILFWVNADKIT